MPELFASKKDCCGCAACVNACPVGIISMTADEEGFLYPQITDADKCIGCGKCQSCCPLKNTGPKSGFVEFYAGSLKKRDDLVTSASGGAATAIARGFVREGGVVYGAAYSQDFKKIQYCRCDDPESLEGLKTSKYAQAEKNDIYKQIRADLKAERRVLFFGMPCDVAAVKKLFPQYESSLYTAELICHGPTSGKVHSQYAAYLEQKGKGKLTYISTRHKRNGKWKPFYLFAVLDNGKTYMVPFHESVYGAAFRYLKRPSCYSCRIKGEQLQADLMLGDYHYVEAGMKGYNPHGVSSILVHNEKGKTLLELCRDFEITPIQKRCAQANRAIFSPIPKPKGKEQFTQVFVNKGIMKAGSLPMVKMSNFQRKTKAMVMSCGVKLKRLLIKASDD